VTNKLKQIREERGMPISELSRRSGLCRQTIYNIEGNPNRNLDAKTMEAIAAALGLKVSQIFLL